MNEREETYLGVRARSEGARSASKVLLGALRYLMDPIGEEQRAYDAWRDDVRRKIEIGYRECLEGKTVDGEAAFERIRLDLESRRSAR